MESDLTLATIKNSSREYEILISLFKEDSIFQGLVNSLKENGAYYKSLTFSEALDEVSWWILEANIPCEESNLISRNDIKGFSFYIILKYILKIAG